MNQDSLQILFAEEAFDWLDSPGKQSAWEALYQRCPWHFPTLGPQYYRLWFHHYSVEWQPILATVETAEGELRLVIPLAMREGMITGVGANQAEYQGWLCAELEPPELLQAALVALDTRFPAHTLRLLYLAPGIPEGTVQYVCESNAKAIHTIHSRPLIRLDGEFAGKALRKKSTRSKINRLKRRGELSFRRLTDVAEIENRLDAIIAMYDFRQGAANDSCPFVDDPYKKAFLLGWAKQSAGEELHISCLMLDDEIIGAHIGVISGNSSQLAILAYSPRYSAYSPGKIQIYETARLLAEEGVSWLDLTPGGDPWKERFANEHKSVLSLTVHASRRIAHAIRLKSHLDSLVRRLLDRTGIAPRDIKGRLRSLRQAVQRPEENEQKEEAGAFVVYQLTEQPPTRHLTEEEFHRDALHDLTLYRGDLDGVTRQVFLQKALIRIESGESFYTLVRSDRLAASAWVKHDLAETAIIHDICCPADQRGHLSQFIGDVLAHMNELGTDTVHLHVRSMDWEEDDWITSLGFVPIKKSVSDTMYTGQPSERAR